MGNHRVASAAPRAGDANQYATEAPAARFTSPRALALRNWPVSTRLIAVIVLALLMGLIFGGLRVASAADSADEFGRVSQLAVLGQQVTGLVQALENERDETSETLPVSDTSTLNSAYGATNVAAAKVQSLAAGIGGGFPANIQARVAAVDSEITHLRALRISAQASQSALAVIADYAAPITDMIALNDQIAQGTSDSILVNDVQTLNALSLAKDQAATAACAAVQRVRAAALRRRRAAGADHLRVPTARRPDRVQYDGHAGPEERVPQHRGRAAVRRGREH